MPDASALQLEKSALRRRMLEAREALSEAERGRAAHAVAARVRPLLETRSPSAISGFLPIGAEMDPRPALVAARQLGWRICLPVMISRRLPLNFRAYAPGDALVERMWGIREPAESAAVLVPEVLIVPLLAFDRRGGRLGYGGGYYDRTLGALRAAGPVLAVGLAFDQQGVDAVPSLDYDERLDHVLTPSEFIDCRTAS